MDDIPRFVKELEENLRAAIERIDVLKILASGNESELAQRLDNLLQERHEAVQILRSLCRLNQIADDWPETLHLAEAIEKRFYNNLKGE